MAQLVEHILGKDEVPSSNLGISSIKTAKCSLYFFNFFQFLLIIEKNCGIMLCVPLNAVTA